MRPKDYRRGNFENDILAILIFTAKAAQKLEDRKHRPSGKWVTLGEMAEPPPWGTGIPRATLNYIFHFEGQGIIIRKRRNQETGEEYADVKESVMDRIAAKYGISYKIRRIHTYDNGARRVPCSCGNPTDEWEIAASFIEEPKDADWDRFVQRSMFFGGEHAVDEV